MDLQAELISRKDHRAEFFRALRGCVQRRRFIRNHRRVLQQLQRIHQFVPFQRVLPAKAIGIGTLLDFSALEGSRSDSAPGNHFSLMDLRTDTRRKPRIDLAKLHACFRQRDAFYLAHFAVGGKQQSQLRLQRNFEGIFPERALPAIHVRFLRRQHHVAALRERRSLRDGNRLRRARRHAFARQSIRGRKSPRSVRQHANADANRFALRQCSNLPVLRGQVALPQMHRAHVAVRGAAQFRRIQCIRAEIPHARFFREKRNSPTEKFRAPRPGRDALRR